MKATLILIALIGLAGCVSKTLVKNCDKTESGDYFVCDTVIFK